MPPSTYYIDVARIFAAGGKGALRLGVILKFGISGMGYKPLKEIFFEFFNKKWVFFIETPCTSADAILCRLWKSSTAATRLHATRKRELDAKYGNYAYCACSTAQCCMAGIVRDRLNVT